MDKLTARGWTNLFFGGLFIAMASVFTIIAISNFYYTYELNVQNGLLKQEVRDLNKISSVLSGQCEAIKYHYEENK